MGTGWSSRDVASQCPQQSPIVGEEEKSENEMNALINFAKQRGYLITNEAKPKELVQGREKSQKTTVAQVKQPQPQPQQQLPHNYEEIVKDADSIIDKSADLHAGIFLNQKKKKYWIDENSNNCFMVYPRDLAITWSDENRYWKWLPLEETGDGPIDAAELWNVCWLEVRGKFDTTKLSPGTLYQVVFKVMIKAASYGWESPVTVGLKVPYGNNQETEVSLMRRERGKFIDIPVGEFRASQGEVGNIEFSLCGTEGRTWKRGLVIRGVVIRPKN